MAKARTSGRGGKRRATTEKTQAEIVKTVEYGGKTYGPGQEDALKDAGLKSAEIKRLEEKGAIRGFTRGAGLMTESRTQQPGEGEGERLPGDPSPIENEEGAETRRSR